MDVTLSRSERQPEQLRPLFDAYAAMLYDVDAGMRACLANQNYDEELLHLSEKYAAPYGSIYLLRCDSASAGMGALCRLTEDTGELKRIFLFPEYRGKGLGLFLVQHLLDDAASCGYRHIRLDTFPAMVPACGLYRKLGFYPIPRYNNNPLTAALFFQKDL